MAKTLLLLGAGFSRTWGGWLAKEVFEYLLGHPNFRNHQHLKDTLWRRKDEGFEKALENIQNEWRNNQNNRQKIDQLTGFNDALNKMFEDMQVGLDNQINGLEFPNQTGIQTGKVKKFLQKFDAIFTLNQDLLLERHYRGHFPQGGKYTDMCIPGVMWVQANGKWNVDNNVSQNPPTIPHQHQPYFKLHGSYKWSNTNSNRILVMGGFKTVQISGTDILDWYHGEFQTHLNEEGSKLMIIGYSFGDKHINDAIEPAIAQGLKIFVIDPTGVDNVPTSLQPAVIGGSRRYLSDTFRENGDAVEYNKVMSFFA